MERARLIELVRATGCAEERGEFWFLCDPKWGAAERARFSEIGDWRSESGRNEDGFGWLCVPTGGTSGGLKFARHDEATLTAAARGFCAHFGLVKVNAVDVLPGFHVSGLMARVRCAESGGEHVAWDWKRLEAGQRPELTTAGKWVISLVPTQLQRLLVSEGAREWLRQFAVILVGGGPVWPSLADEAARHGLAISLSYGMSETAAMVTALKPAEFLAGARSSGTALPHARVTVNGDGAICVEGGSVFRGYFPEWHESRSFETQDAGRIDADGQLHVLGRRDALIITGGKKVNPTEVEAALRESGEFADVAVIGVPDVEWGEAVVACYPAGGREPAWARVDEALRAVAAFKRPKRFVAVDPWPRNEQGKVKRAELAAILAKT